MAAHGFLDPASDRRFEWPESLRVVRDNRQSAEEFAGTRRSLPPDSLLQAKIEALRILHIEVPLSPKRQFQLFCSEHFLLADILDCLDTDQLWALLSMRVQLADSDKPHALS